MTISRIFGLLISLALCPTFAAAQTHPKELTWSVGQLAGSGEWTTRLPELLLRGLSDLDLHQLSDAERSLLRQRYLDSAQASAQQQASRALVELAKKQLKGPLPASEPAATVKVVADSQNRATAASLGKTEGAEAPVSLVLKPVWAPDRPGLPWSATDRVSLAEKTQALYLVTGEVRTVGESVSVQLALYSQLEDRVLAEWVDRFTTDEAPARMVAASEHLRGTLLGRPWAGLSLRSPIEGTRVRMGEQWHDLPWTSALLEPATVEVLVRSPGRPDRTQTIELLPGVTVTASVGDLETTAEKLVLETDPPGVSLYMDSRYLGPSPQTIDRPTATTRIRAQAPGWQTAAWEVGPTTGPTSHLTLIPPQRPADVPGTKDRFYWSLAAFSFSLTTSAFATSWAAEQVNLANAYDAAGDTAGWNTAYQRWQQVSVVKWSAIALTSGLFVWMMFELGDYLQAAQSSLP